MKEHLRQLHRQQGKLPEDLNRLFDESTIPSPANDILYGVKPARPAVDTLELICDFCPRKAASTAGELYLDALPQGLRGALRAADQTLCAVCPKTLMTKLAA